MAILVILMSSYGLCPELIMTECMTTRAFLRVSGEAQDLRADGVVP